MIINTLYASFINYIVYFKASVVILGLATTGLLKI